MEVARNDEDLSELCFLGRLQSVRKDRFIEPESMHCEHFGLSDELSPP